MARPRVLDFLQVYPFWIVDLSWSAFGGMAFTPLLGFQSCSSPEITIELQEVNEGNWFYAQHHIRKASVSEMTLGRGVQFYDSDFYKWAIKAIQGQGVVKRDLMLVHYFAISPVTIAEQMAEYPVTAINATFMAGIQGVMMAKIFKASPFGGAQVATAQGRGAVSQVISQATGYGPPVDHAPRFPAKAWILRRCLPTRWKAASDFDAMSGDVSIAELAVQPHRIEELSVAT